MSLLHVRNANATEMASVTATNGQANGTVMTTSHASSSINNNNNNKNNNNNLQLLPKVNILHSFFF